MQYTIAVVHGDGIGPEVCSAALEVLRAVPGLAEKLVFREYPAGAEHYRKTGDAFPESTFEGLSRRAMPSCTAPRACRA